MIRMTFFLLFLGKQDKNTADVFKLDGTYVAITDRTCTKWEAKNNNKIYGNEGLVIKRNKKGRRKCFSIQEFRK